MEDFQRELFMTHFQPVFISSTTDRVGGDESHLEILKFNSINQDTQ